MTTITTARPHSPLRQYLFDLTLHGIKLGLDNIQALLRAAEAPHLAYPTIHVGGTNGKGSVVAMLSAMLTAAGYRVGRFTSPHLIDVSERFLIDGTPIEEADLEENILFFKEVAESMPQYPTFFEMNTAIAFRHFARQQVDVALIEVGMGGRFDSTNVVQPIATAITNIDLEHTAFLGDTIAAIAGEKAGIIKPGVPVVTAERNPEALAVFRAASNARKAPLLEVEHDKIYTVSGSPWAQQMDFHSDTLTITACPLGLPGAYQGANAAVAIALADQITTAFPRLDATTIATGLQTASWPCRLERVLQSPPTFIDVAHNEAGAQRLADHLDPCVMVFAASSDKDAAAMLRALQPKAKHLLITRFEGKRAASTEALSAHLVPGSYAVHPTLPEAIKAGMALASESTPLVITGSIYAAGEAREYLIQHHGATPLQF